MVSKTKGSGVKVPSNRSDSFPRRLGMLHRDYDSRPNRHIPKKAWDVAALITVSAGDQLVLGLGLGLGLGPTLFWDYSQHVMTLSFSIVNGPISVRIETGASLNHQPLRSKTAHDYGRSVKYPSSICKSRRKACKLENIPIICLV